MGEHGRIMFEKNMEASYNTKKLWNYDEEKTTELRLHLFMVKKHNTIP